jgi:hypothetical protein
MRVITEYPVYIDKKLIGGEDFLSLDGKSSKAEIKAFQSWYNKAYSGLQPLVVDGIWGKNTAERYANVGAEYDAMLKPKQGKPNVGVGAGIGAGANAGAGAGAEAAAAQSKQGILDKIGEAFGITDDKAAETPDKKGMSKTVKYVLIGVGVLAVLGLGYALLKKK